MTDSHGKTTDARGLLSPGKILGYVTSLVVLRVIVKFAGFGEKIALAYFFDIDKSLDAFTAAISLPLMFMFSVGAIVNSTLLPIFVRHSGEGNGAKAWSQIHAWFLVISLFLCSAAAGCYVFADKIAWGLAPGFDVDRHDLCVSMLRILIPASVLLGLHPLLLIPLNAQRRFAYAPIGDFVVKVIVIGAICLFAERVGITAAVWGTVAGTCLSFMVYTIGIAPTWTAHGSAPNYSDKEFKLVMFLMIAPALGAIFSRVGEIGENAASSMLAPGSVAALALARKIINAPLLIVPVASGAVLYTLFSEMNQRGDHESAARTLAAGIRAMLFIFLPIAVLTCVLSEPIIAFVYQRGAFDAESTRLVSRILFWLAPIMCALSVEVLIMRHFFSRLDIWPPILIGILCVTLRIVLIFALVKPMGLPGVALAMIVSRYAKVFLLALMVQRRGKVSRAHLEITEMLKLLPASFIAGGIAFVISQWLQGIVPSSTIGCFILLSSAGGMGGLAYIATTYYLKCRECQFIVKKIVEYTPRLPRFV